jgi:tetratricopeptide (TPR) repeat protein
VRRDSLFIAALLLLTFATFWPVGSLGFIGYDDLDYVYKNPMVQSGLNVDSAVWAFTTNYASNWHPVTWLSLMLDSQLFGLNPHAFHWMNLGIHAANTVLLFVWLSGVTRARWRSFFVAALFAVHPLHVESVAWIAERKDVLSGFFFMLILLGYTRYSRKPTTRNLVLVCVLFALGLMAKPMLVTVPLVLLLLDYWPLQRYCKETFNTQHSTFNAQEAQAPALHSPSGEGGPPMSHSSHSSHPCQDTAPAQAPFFLLPSSFFIRWLKLLPLRVASQRATGGGPGWGPSTLNVECWMLNVFPVFKRLLIEKIPLFLLCLLSCQLTLWSQRAGGAMILPQYFPLWNRCLHAVIAYSLYLGKLFWPVNLAIYYPLPLGAPPVATLLGALALLIILTLAALKFGCPRPPLLKSEISNFKSAIARPQPWLPVGWAWFLIMLVPTIGIVQVGLQSIADRYAYLPSIGLFIAMVWGMAALFGVAHQDAPASAGGVPPPELLPLRVASQRPPSVAATANEGTPSVAATTKGGLPPVAAAAKGGGPGWGPSKLNVECWMLNVFLSLIVLLCSLDTRHQLAYWRNNITLFEHALQVSPKNNYLGNFYLGISYAEAGRLDDAARSLTNAMVINPDSELARGRLGNVLLWQGNYAAAQTVLEKLVQEIPQFVVARVTLGLALAGQHKYTAAQAEYQAALQLYPGDPSIQRLVAVNTPKAAAEQTLTNLAAQAGHSFPISAFPLSAFPPEMHAQAAQAYVALARFPQAAQEYTLALAQKPGTPDWLNNLAWLLATCPDPAVRDGSRAVQLARRACEATQYQIPVYLGTLAAAYAEAGQFDNAILYAQKACDRAAAVGQTGLWESNQALLKLYQARQPCRDTPPSDWPLNAVQIVLVGWTAR